MRAIGIEGKTRNVTVSVRPSVYENFKKVAYMKQLSPNSLFGMLMSDCVRDNSELIKQYDKEVNNQ